MLAYRLGNLSFSFAGSPLAKNRNLSTPVQKENAYAPESLCYYVVSRSRYVARAPCSMHGTNFQVQKIAPLLQKSFSLFI